MERGKNELIIPTDLVWRKMDDNTIVVSPKNGKVRVLNDVGTLIWEELAAGQSVSDIHQRIIAEYDITAEQAAQDLHNFLCDLQQRGLVTSSTHPA